MSSPVEVKASICGEPEPTAHDREVLAHALNDHFSESGQNHPVLHDDDTDSADEP